MHQKETTGNQKDTSGNENGTENQVCPDKSIAIKNMRHAVPDFEGHSWKSDGGKWQ